MVTAREVDRLRIQTGDVVLLRPQAVDHDSLGAYHRQAELIRNHLWAQGIEDVLILILAPGTELTAMDEATMREAGWARIEE